MNSMVIVVISLCVFALAYRFYASFIATKVLMLDKNRITPAVRHNDGRDYVPMNKWVLFGHHFAAIAGAGPLVGPVLAAQFGYLPGMMWILIGAVFAGAVHDFVILFASIRHDGESLMSIARKEVGPITGVATGFAILFIMVVALAGLALVIVNALYNNPWGTFTITMTIPIAIFVGLYMFKFRPGAIGSGSAIGVILVLLAVIVGPYVQASPTWAAAFTLTDQQLKVILPLYGFFAAVLPVWLLLAPRDYLSSYMKIGTIALLALGIIIVHPSVHMPAVTQFVNGGGPVVSGKVWPYMFITIACGAISGFHSLIGSGTTPKMVANEAEAKFIGYGAMVTEGFVAIMALIAATVLQPGDYFAINTAKAAFPAFMAKTGIAPVDLATLSQMVGIDVAGRPGGAVSLAVGMAYIFSSIPGMKGLMSYWYQFAIMFEALFILTTIDAGTRVGRYILQDFLGHVYKPLKQVNWWPGILFTSAVISFSWGYLLYGGTISTIWPMFGMANQLLSGLALAIGTTIILKIAKPVYAWITAIPMIFLLATTLAAGYLNITTIYIPKNMPVSTTLSVMMMILTIIIIVDSIPKWLRLLKTDKPIGMNIEVSGK